jgi:hypothetical protein
MTNIDTEKGEKILSARAIERLDLLMLVGR